MKKLALATITALFILLGPAQATAPTLTMSGVAAALSKLGFATGKVVSMPSGDYRLRDIAIEQRPDGRFGIIFGADPV